MLNNELSKIIQLENILNRTHKIVLNKRKGLHDHLSSVHLSIFNTLILEIGWTHQSLFTHVYKYYEYRFLLIWTELHKQSISSWSDDSHYVNTSIMVLNYNTIEKYTHIYVK